MNILEILKKYIFVVILAILLVGFSILFVVDQNKDVISGKSNDGKDVIATINGKYIYAEDLFNDKFDDYAAGESSKFIEKIVILNAYETDADMEKEIDTMVESINDGLLQQGTQDEVDEYIETWLIQYGFESMEEYCEYLLKYETFIEDLIEENKVLEDKYYAEENPRIVAHILVKMKDSKNPTEDELEKVAKIEAELAKGTKFEEVAEKYSDDSSGTNGGILASIATKSNEAQYVKEFNDAALALDKNEVSDWVIVSNDSYNGYHLIKVIEDDASKIYDDADYEDELETNMTNYILSNNPKLYPNKIWELAKEQDIKFKDADFEKAVREALGADEIK